MNQIQSSKVGEVFVEICNAVENDRMRGGQPGDLLAINSLFSSESDWSRGQPPGAGVSAALPQLQTLRARTSRGPDDQ